MLLEISYWIMKRKFLCLGIVRLLTIIVMVNNPTIPEHKQTTTFNVGNSCPGLGQAQKCDEVKTVGTGNSLMYTTRNILD